MCCERVVVLHAKQQGVLPPAEYADYCSIDNLPRLTTISAALPCRAAQCWHSAVIGPWSRAACSAPLLAELGGIFGADPGRLSTAASVCEAHGKDESYHAAIGPDAVAFPSSTAEVSQVDTVNPGITSPSHCTL